MKDVGSLHLKVQEHIDCLAANDPLKEMSMLQGDPDQDEAALKWLALAALHAINSNAKKISISRAPDGQVTVTAKYREAQLPSPGPAVGAKVIEAVREITHLEGDKGETPLALGIRDHSTELQIKIKPEDGGEKITIKFP